MKQVRWLPKNLEKVVKLALEYRAWGTSIKT